MYNKDKTLENYKVMKNNSIQYKKQLAISKCNYQNTICVNLRQLKSKSSKQFWDLLNKSTSLMQSKVLCIPYEKLYIHFQKLFSDPNTSNILPSAFDDNYQNHVLNMPFHIHEISESIKLLKINKASGKDNLINEYFKNATVDMIPTITHLFNIILNSGIIPSEWTKGIIKPLYKNKGSADEPENYRGITLLSVFGKLFTATINRRLETYLQNENIIGEEQAGFRKEYSTTDHTFVLTYI